MILTCPECSTNYMAKDGTIGSNGRSVRCARCETVWYVEGVDPDALALEDNQTVLMTAEPDIQPELPFEPEDSPAETFGSETVGAHTLLRDKADAVKLSKRKRAIGLIWAISLLILLLAALFVIFKRQAIVNTFPKSSTLYQAFGLSVKANGLDIRGLSDERLVVDGNPILRVTGEVVNLTSEAIFAPTIQFRLENRSGEPVADWYYEPGTIEAGDSVNIETDYPAPPIDAKDLRYRFVPEE